MVEQTLTLKDDAPSKEQLNRADADPQRRRDGETEGVAQQHDCYGLVMQNGAVVSERKERRNVREDLVLQRLALNENQQLRRPEQEPSEETA